MLEIINKCLGGILMPTMLILIGLFFAFKLKFFYLLHPIKTVKTMLQNQKGGFKSLTVALAGTLGVGNIVGVSSALMMGGAGAVFWMWLSALAAMSLKYAEVFLAVRYRKESKGQNYGGAPYYIYEGMGKKIGFRISKPLSLIFAFLCICNSLSTGNLVQVNAVCNLLPVPKIVFGLVFTAGILLIVIGGIKRISSFTYKMIPFLSFCYIIISFFIILTNYEKIPSVMSEIIGEAFKARSAVSGFCGYGITVAMRYGVSRGVLSNEAGCGTAPTAHASSDTSSAHSQACLGILEVFVDTVVLCSLTAFVILISNLTPSGNAMTFVAYSFEKYTGDFGLYFIIVSSVLFAFATVACQFYYGEQSLKYINSSKNAYFAYVALFCSVSVIASVIPMSLMWQISDLVIGVMTVFNLICLLFLSQEVKASSYF